MNSILSIVNKHNNRQDQAKHYEELAEQNANAEISGLRYKTLAVVTEREDWLDKILESK